MRNLNRRKQRHYRYLPPLPRADADADNKGQNAEAHDVAERIELYAEALLLIRAIFFRARDYTVEHIAEAREHKAYDRRNDLTLYGKPHAGHRRQHTDKGQPHRVIIITYQEKHLQFALSTV